MTIKAKEPLGRLALRAEGDMWNAYYALPDTMEKAIPLGSIRLAIVANPARKGEFMDLMRSAVADLIQEQIGVRPAWQVPITAPAGEKEGEGHA